MIQSGIRNKERFQGELYVVYAHRLGLSHEETARIETYLQLARLRPTASPFCFHNSKRQGMSYELTVAKDLSGSRE